MKKIVLIVSAILVMSTVIPSFGENFSSRRQDIADKLYEIYIRGGDHLGYCNEILDHLNNAYSITPTKIKENQRAAYRERSWRGRGEVDAFSLFSGGLAIRESLQLETIRESKDKSGEVKISTLKGPSASSHPFNEMLKGRSYKLFPIDSYCPEDFYYVHFNNMGKALEFFDYLGSVGGSIYKKFTPKSADFMLKQKILKMLALRENKEARKFYNMVISEMAIVGSDPFINSGSDVTLIYKIKQEIIFKSEITGHRKYFAEKYGAKPEQVDVRGYSVEYLHNSDRSVNSYYFALPDGVFVISNSKRGCEAVVDTLLGKRGSMGKAADYRYMRSIYPADQNDEDAFVFLSDAFIRYLVGPELRIKESRRMGEAMRLSLAERLLLYHYQLKSKTALSVDDLYAVTDSDPIKNEDKKLIEKIKAHRLFRLSASIDKSKMNDWETYYKALAGLIGKKSGPEFEDFKQMLIKLHRDIIKNDRPSPAQALELLKKDNLSIANHYRGRLDGIAVSSNGFGAVSPEYGRLGYMIPNIEHDIDMVSQKEAADYKRFMEEYNSFWREYFDPIGIRIKMNNGIRVETCILPLINNSIYDGLSRLIGGAPVKLHPDNMIKGEIFGFSVKLDPDVVRQIAGDEFEYRSETDKKKFKQIAGLFDAIGNEARISMLDTRLLVDFDGGLIFREMMRKNHFSDDMLWGLLAWSMFHPMRISVPLKPEISHEEMLQIVDSQVSQLRYRFGRDVGFSNYSYDYKSARVRVIKISFFETLKFRIYYIIQKGTLHITSTKFHMERLIDEGERNGDASNSNVVMSFRPAQMELEKPQHRESMLDSLQSSSFKNFGTIRLMSLIFPGEKNLAAKCLELYRFKPVCPLKGIYRVDPKTGEVSNSMFGTLRNPVIPEGKKVKLVERFFSTEEVRVEFEFTREGIKTRITTK